MKAITIKQPFASLIAEGLKTYEFRTWKTSYRGKILIHAGKCVDKEVMKRFETVYHTAGGECWLLRENSFV